MKEFNWIKNAIEQKNGFVKSVRKKYNLSDIAAKLLCDRLKPNQINEFLDPTYEDLHDPYLFKEMNVAVDRILLAKEKQQKIFINGDYDVDGVMSTTILKLIFDKLGIQSFPFTPPRSLGYGLSEKMVRFAIRKNYEVIVACDCGSNEHKNIKLAKQYGIDVIVFDHHCYKTRPDVLAFINPESKDYPFQHLCATGVVFKFSQAMEKHYDLDTKSYLPLVAVATIADVVSMSGENRILTKLGLAGLKHTSNIGLHYLIKVCSLQDRKIMTEEVGFIIAPKINAAGRISSPTVALKLFLTDDKDKAYKLSRKLANLNKKRMEIEKTIRDEALEQAEKYQDDNFVVLSSDNWHTGIIGIVASTVTEIYHKPTVVIAKGYGSVRTIPEVTLIDKLLKCHDLLGRWGGHEMAAGLQITNENIVKFRKRINKIVNKKYERGLRYDLKLQFNDINGKLWSDIESIEPFGPDNHEPNFVLEDVRFENAKLTKNQMHLQMKVIKDYKLLSAVGFWMPEHINKLIDPAQKIDVLFTIERNVYNTVQIVLKDLKTVALDW